MISDYTVWYQRATLVLKTVSTSLSFLVTFVLVPLQEGSLRDSLHRQAVLGAIVGVDLCVSAVPVRLLRFIYADIVLVAYILFTLILHWTGVIHAIYPDLFDWSKEPVKGAIVCLILVFIVMPMTQVFAFLIHHLVTHHILKCRIRDVENSDAGTSDSDDENSTLMSSVMEDLVETIP